MAVVLNCGFECGSNLDKWTMSSAATTIQTSTVRTGARSLRTNAAAAASYSQHFLQAAAATHVGRFYVRWASLPNTATDTRFALFVTASGGDSQIMTDSGGVVTYGIVTGTQVIHPTTVTTGTWYRVDYRILNNDGTGTKKLDVQINGVAGTQATLSQAGSNVTAVRLGNPSAAITTDVFFDDLIIGNDTADYPFGAGQSTPIFPTGDGAHSFTAGDFGNDAGTIATSATTTWQKIDDSPVPLGGAALTANDWLEQIVNRTTGYVEHTYDFSAITSDPRAITANVAVQAETAASAGFEVRLNDNGTVETGTTIPATVAVTTIRNAYKTRATRPSTSTAWTVASLSTLRTRWGYSGDAAPDVRLDAIVLEIDFNPNITVTPTTLALVDTQFAPTVTISDNQLVTPTTASLAAVAFAPVLKETVTTGFGELTISVVPPDVTVSQGEVVIPTTAVLELNPNSAPTVTITDHQLVTPSTAALTITANAPTVLTPELVIPTTASVALAVFVPTVTATDHQAVTAGTASLTLSAFVPTVDISDVADIVPPNAVLALGTFAPTVTATAHQAVTPDAVSLVLSAHTPTVTASDHQRVTPTTAALVTARFAPTVTATAHQVVTPPTRALTLGASAPTIRYGLEVPATSLTTSGFEPTVSATTNAYAFPPNAALTLTPFAPDIELSAFQQIEPATAVLVITTYPPTAEQHSITPLPRLIYGFAIVAVGDSAGVEVASGGATVRSEGGNTAVSTSGPSARVTIR